MENYSRNKDKEPPEDKKDHDDDFIENYREENGHQDRNNSSNRFPTWNGTRTGTGYNDIGATGSTPNFDDDYTVDASTMASVSLAISPDGTCPRHPHVRLKELGPDGYLYQKESCPACDEDFKNQRKSLHLRKKELDRQLEQLEQIQDDSDHPVDQEETNGADPSSTDQRVNGLLQEQELIPNSQTTQAQNNQRRGRTDEEVELDSSIPSQTISSTNNYFPTNNPSMINPLFYPGYNAWSQAQLPPINPATPLAALPVPGDLSFSNQLTMMRHMQDLILQEKNAEIQSLRARVDDLQQQLMQKQVEVAVLKERMESQEKFRQQEARLVKLAAMAAAANTNPKSQGPNASDGRSSSVGSNDSIASTQMDKKGSLSGSTNFGGSTSKGIHIQQLHVQVGSNIAGSDPRAIESATQTATAKAIDDAVAQHERQQLKQQKQQKHHNLRTLPSRSKKNAVVPPPTVPSTSQPVASKSMAVPQKQTTRTSYSAAAAVPVQSNSAPSSALAEESVSAPVNERSSRSMPSPAANSTTLLSSANLSQPTRQSSNNDKNLMMASNRVDENKDYSSINKSSAAVVVAATATTAAAGVATTAVVTSTPSPDVVIPPTADSKDASIIPDADKEESMGEEGSNEDMNKSLEQDVASDDEENNVEEEPKVENDNGHDDDDDDVDDSEAADTFDETPAHWNAHSQRKDPLQASLTSFNAPLRVGAAAERDGPQEFPLQSETSPALYPASHQQGQTESEQPHEPHQLLNPQIELRDNYDNSGNDDLSIDNTSLGNTVASSTYGEDRYTVRNRSLLDPYGDRGQYSGVLLRSTGMPHGTGRMIYDDDGRTYTGDWRHGRWHGHGRATFANNDGYEGEYRYDQRHGRGKYVWSDGRIYDGEFCEDKRHGKGTFTWPDGATYVGDFNLGQRHGFGRYKFSDGGYYVGNWTNGRYHGFGECHWHDGRSYKGEWRDGMAHGQGVETYPNGRVRHDGEWYKDDPVVGKDSITKKR